MSMNRISDGSEMNREQIIETMAKVAYDEDYQAMITEAHRYFGEPNGDSARSEADAMLAQMGKALTALETAIPGLAGVIAGKAYFAPRGIADGTMHVLLEKEFPGFAGLLAGTHVIVPVEATEVMKQAFQWGSVLPGEIAASTNSAVYRAMIEARPK